MHCTKTKQLGLGFYDNKQAAVLIVAHGTLLEELEWRHFFGTR
ncbi:jg2071, partial [Pararge aegeria aegeria]